MNTRVLIVEDEPLAIDQLRSCLAHHEELMLVGAAANGTDAIELINELDPDLVFLDVLLPGASGFDVLRQIRRTPAVIFTTAHDGYAVAAFEWGAFDYLLKPFGRDRFAIAVQRFLERKIRQEQPANWIERLATTESRTMLTRFFVQHRGQTLPVHAADILRIIAADDYCEVYLTGRCYTVHLPLREFAHRLDPKMFVRVHRSAIVNLEQVSRLEQNKRHLAVHLRDGSIVQTSRSGAQALRLLRW